MFVKIKVTLIKKEENCGMIILLVILLIIGGVAVFAINAYNNIQRLNINVDKDESQINVQLQRRAYISRA